LRVLKGITESELTPTGVSINIDDTLKELYIPFDVESHAEDAILMESIIYFDKLGWTIKSIPGTFVGSSKDSWKTFLSGYFAELYSTQKVSNILLQKDKPFQNGRACARYEILKALVPAETQSYIRNIDIDIIGKSKKEPGRLKSTISSNIIEKERDNVLHILKVAAKAATTSNKDFEFSKFLVSYEDLIAKHKRSKKSIKQSKTKKGNKPISVVENISATKPSSLSTIAPFEKQSIIELYETPWSSLEKLREVFNNTPRNLIKYQEYESKIQLLINEQWLAKNKVLSLTRHREIKVFKEDKKSLDITKTIAETQKNLQHIDNEEDYKIFLKSSNGIIPWLPIMGGTGIKQVSDHSFKSWLETEQNFNFTKILVKLSDEVKAEYVIHIQSLSVNKNIDLSNQYSILENT
jgi:hypothetical protein